MEWRKQMIPDYLEEESTLYSKHKSPLSSIIIIIITTLHLLSAAGWCQWRGEAIVNTPVCLFIPSRIIIVIFFILIILIIISRLLIYPITYPHRHRHLRQCRHHCHQHHRLEICQTYYTTRFSGQKFYTLTVRKLRLFLLKEKQRISIYISYFSTFFVRIKSVSFFTVSVQNHT